MIKYERTANVLYFNLKLKSNMTSSVRPSIISVDIMLLYLNVHILYN